jgi:hypothetical protein
MAGPITSTGWKFTTYMLPVGSINIFIGLTDAIENFDDSAQNMRMRGFDQRRDQQCH